jgi:hypothetical protein
VYEGSSYVLVKLNSIVILKKLSKSYYDLHAILILIVSSGLTSEMGNLQLSLINNPTDSRYLRIYGNIMAKITVVFSFLVLFSSCSIPVLSVNGQTYFPSNTIQQSSNIFSPFFPISRQSISPWFPSLPAISCGAGIFSFTIEGLPDKGVNIPINDEELMALQIELDKDHRGSIWTTSNDVSGKIFVGKNNIKTNQGDDFDVKNLFNNCRTLVFSSTGDAKIKTPLPATPTSDRVDTVILPTPFTGNNINQFPANNYICPTGYYRNSQGYCVPLLQ